MLTILLNNAQKFYKKAYEMLSLDFIYCKIEGKKEWFLKLFQWQLNRLESVKFSFN